MSFNMTGNWHVPQGLEKGPSPFNGLRQLDVDNGCLFMSFRNEFLIRNRSALFADLAANP